jgi:hypothetical protein
MSQAGQFLIWLMLFLIEMRFEIDFPAALLGNNRSPIAVAYSPSSTRYARHIDLRAKFVARVLKMRDYTLAYIRTHSNIADQFTKIVDPVSFRSFRDWMANGLDDQWDMGRRGSGDTGKFISAMQDARDGGTQGGATRAAEG